MSVCLVGRFRQPPLVWANKEKGPAFQSWKAGPDSNQLITVGRYLSGWKSRCGFSVALTLMIDYRRHRAKLSGWFEMQSPMLAAKRPDSG